MEGSIIKGVGGFYYVSTDQGLFTCKAKGAFRREGIVPVVGDRVRITVHTSGYAQIDEIFPRRNMLVRPAVANIDRLLIVLSAHLPEPDWLLADKLIVQATLNRIEPVMVLNKADEADPAIRERCLRPFGRGIKRPEERYFREGLLLRWPIRRGKVFVDECAAARSRFACRRVDPQDRPREAYHSPRPALALLWRRAAGYSRFLPL